MNWGQFKDLVYYLSLAVSMVASWSVKREVAGSNNYFPKEILTELSEFTENI